MAYSFAGNQAADFSYPGSSSGQTVTFPNPLTPGSLIVILLTSTGGIPAFADGASANTYFRVAAASATGGYGIVQMWLAVNTSSSALAISWSGTSLAFPAVQIAEFLTDQIPCIDRIATNTGVTGTAVTLDAVPGLVIALPCPSGGQQMNAGAGWTTTNSGGTASPIIYNVESSTGTYTPTFNNSGGVISVSFMQEVATDMALDFRATAGYVTDPIYAVPQLGEAFPTGYISSNGQIIMAGGLGDGAGFSSGGARDRNSGNNAQLAGINQNNGNGSTPSFCKFLLTLPSTGAWKIIAAFGDPSNDQSQYVKLYDGATLFATYTNVFTAANSFMDASGNVFTEANWLTSNVALAQTFTTNSLLIQLGPDTAASSNSSTISTLRLTKVVSATGANLRMLMGVGT